MRFWPFYTEKIIQSEKNGSLQVVSWFGKTAVIGDGVFQSGRYMQRVFMGMLRMLPRAFHPKKILVVGLGAGGCIPVIQRRFKGAHIVALEYDEVMVALAKETFLREADVGSVEIVHGDMCETLPRLATEFDLILVDVFCGRNVAPALASPDVLRELRRLLSWQGYLLVNVFEERDAFAKPLEAFFSLHAVKRIKRNDVLLFRHLALGGVGVGVPEGFKDREQSRMYLRTVIRETPRRKIVQEGGALGERVSLGPFVLERFVHEDEPDCRATEKFRIVFWQPYRGVVPRGWWRILNIFTIYFKRGVAVLEDAEYWKRWSSHARRHREKFLHDKRYEIVEVDLETFARAYHATKFLDPLTRRSFVSILRYHLAKHPNDVHLCVVRQTSDWRILSGLATIDYDDISQSDHVIAFIHPDAQNTSVGVGLINHWFEHGVSQGLRFLNFGILRRPGDPRSWQGYTNFKRQFHLYEILYPRPVFRIILPKHGVI